MKKIFPHIKSIIKKYPEYIKNSYTSIRKRLHDPIDEMDENRRFMREDINFISAHPFQ